MHLNNLIKLTNLLYSSAFSDKFFSKAITSFILLNGKDFCIFDVSPADALDLCWLCCVSMFFKRVSIACMSNEIVVMVVHIFSKLSKKLIILSKQCHKEILIRL